MDGGIGGFCHPKSDKDLPNIEQLLFMETWSKFSRIKRSVV